MLVSKNLHAFSEFTLTAVNAALLSGDIIRQGFNSTFKISKKSGIHNFVTEYDISSEKAIISFIKKTIPNSSFLSEECGLIGSEENLLWIIDPLDGTINFIHSIPIFAVSIAVRKEKEIISGVIYQPMTHELFVGEKGAGAFLNGKKLKVSDVKNISDAFLATSFPYDADSSCKKSLTNVINEGIPVRKIGSTALNLAYTAKGSFDGFWSIDFGPWDCAAGELILKEAGGKLSTWDMLPFSTLNKGTILASNSKIHEQFSKLILS